MTEEKTKAEEDETQSIVINKKYGGFGISEEAVRWLRANGYECGEECVLPGEYYDDGSGPRSAHHSSFGRRIDRDSEGLVAVVEELGTQANTKHSDLKIVEVPNEVEWEIQEYDGVETIYEKHRTWG